MEKEYSGPLYPWVSHPQIQPTTDFDPQLVESADVKPADKEDWLYSLSYTILYKGLEHLWILVCVGPSGTNPLWILRVNCIKKKEKKTQEWVLRYHNVRRNLQRRLNKSIQ